MKLYGKEWMRRDLEARVGRIEQIGGIRRTQWTDGPESGVEEIQVRTGAGLSYSILPSRGLDIGLAEFGGIPLCWLSPNGEVHPTFYNDRGLAWLRSAVGGLLMTCGLTQVGSPGVEGSEELGLHGRAHHTPARHVCAEGFWEGDEYLMMVRGKVEETSIAGWNLRLTRKIMSYLGKNEIVIHDFVENVGFEAAPHMMLYHFNFGFPLLDAETEIHLPSGHVTSREPGMPLDDFDRWCTPQTSYLERVYYHEKLSTTADGTTSIAIRSPHFPYKDKPLVVNLTWKTHSLPRLVQWKMPGEGTYVLGIEPANCHVEGRAAERERGSLVMLKPGQSVEYNLELSVSEE
jgi:hypothetical protein